MLNLSTLEDNLEKLYDNDWNVFITNYENHLKIEGVMQDKAHDLDVHIFRNGDVKIIKKKTVYFDVPYYIDMDLDNDDGTAQTTHGIEEETVHVEKVNSYDKFVSFISDYIYILENETECILKARDIERTQKGARKESASLMTATLDIIESDGFVKTELVSVRFLKKDKITVYSHSIYSEMAVLGRFDVTDAIINERGITIEDSSSPNRYLKFDAYEPLDKIKDDKLW